MLRSQRLRVPPLRARSPARQHQLDADRASRYLVFDDLPSLRLDKPGIYYYGNVVMKDSEGVFFEGPNSEVIAIARRNYPHAFAALDPVNFD